MKLRFLHTGKFLENILKKAVTLLQSNTHGEDRKTNSTLSNFHRHFSRFHQYPDYLSVMDDTRTV